MTNANVLITLRVMIITRSVMSTLLCVVAVLGCADRPEFKKAPISGKVSYNGKLLKNGQIVMVHFASGKMGAGDIGRDGSYRLVAPVGECKVMITCFDQPNASELDPHVGRPLTLPRNLIPVRYNNYQSSGFVVTIVEGENKKDWELVD